MWTRERTRTYNYYVNVLVSHSSTIGASACGLWGTIVLWSTYIAALNLPYLQKCDGYTGLFGLMSVATAVITSCCLYPFFQTVFPLMLLRFFILPEPPDKCVKCQNQITSP